MCKTIAQANQCVCAAARNIYVYKNNFLKLPLCPGWSPWGWGGLPGCRNISSFTTSSQGAGPVPDSVLTFFFSLFFCPTWLNGDFLVLPKVWGLLPGFSRDSVRIVIHVDTFLMYLWEELSFMSCYSATILIHSSKNTFLFYILIVRISLRIILILRIYSRQILIIVWNKETVSSSQGIKDCFIQHISSFRSTYKFIFFPWFLFYFPLKFRPLSLLTWLVRNILSVFTDFID